jgi:hypothetical protein
MNERDLRMGEWNNRRQWNMKEVYCLQGNHVCNRPVSSALCTFVLLRFSTIRRRWRVVKQRELEMKQRGLEMKQRELEMKQSVTCCGVTAGILVEGF